MYHWKTSTSEGNTWTWASGFDAFMPVLRGCAAQAFITVNYGTGTPQEAADWVAYANKTKALGIKYWEIGNENYGTWEADNQAVPNDPYTYAVRAKEYIARMKAVDPSIKIGVVAVTGEDSYANNTNHTAVNPRTGETHYGWTPVMLSTLKSLGVTPDFLTYHRYEQGPGDENDAGLLQSSTTWKDDAANLRQQLADYLQAQGAVVELICAENNSANSNNRCAYLKLDLTSVSVAPKRAMLNLTAGGSSPRTSSSPVKLYYVTNTSWTETGITWNNAPGLNRTRFSSTGSLVASHTVPLGAPTASFDLTAFVAENLGKVVTLQIMSGTVDNNTVGFRSREAPSGRPTLSFAY